MSSLTRPDYRLPILTNPNYRMVPGKDGRPVRLSVQQWVTYKQLGGQSEPVRIANLRSQVDMRLEELSRVVSIRRKGPLTSNDFSSTLRGLRSKIGDDRIQIQGRTKARTAQLIL